MPRLDAESLARAFAADVLGLIAGEPFVFAPHEFIEHALPGAHDRGLACTAPPGGSQTDREGHLARDALQQTRANARRQLAPRCVEVDFEVIRQIGEQRRVVASRSLLLPGLDGGA